MELFKKARLSSTADIFSHVSQMDGFYYIEYDSGEPPSIESHFLGGWVTIVWSGGQIPEQLAKAFDTSYGDGVSQEVFLKSLAIATGNVEKVKI